MLSGDYIDLRLYRGHAEHILDTYRMSIVFRPRLR